MKTLSLSTLMLGTLLALAGCGGGTGGTGSGGGSTTNGVVSVGVMTKGTITLNGVHFDDTAPNIQIQIDGSTGATSSQLQSGMHVKVRGQLDSSGVAGTAQQVSVRSEVRGTVQSHNQNAAPPTFTVVSQTVYVDDLTIFANFAGGAAVTPSAAVGQLSDGTSVVEVHGLRNANGTIQASRVELITSPTAGTDELRGTIATVPNGTTFTLQNGATNVTVNYVGAAVSPSTATLTANLLVEVHGTFNSGTFFATRIDVEDLQDAQFEHQPGEEFEIEGQVSGCGNANPCTLFSVGAQAVQTDGNTRFENGAATDLADGVRVEAEGHTFSGSTLIAEKVEFKRTRVILTGTASVAGTITGPGTFQVLGKTVQVTSLTDFSHTTGGVADAERVEVRGYIDTADNIVAERLDDNPSGGGKDTVQARVTAKTGNILTFSIGINADLTGATQFFDANEQPIADLTTFLAAVTPVPTGGTLVKVRGTFNAGTIAAEEAELEN
jgi:hypothetical protein